MEEVSVVADKSRITKIIKQNQTEFIYVIDLIQQIFTLFFKSYNKKEKKSKKKKILSDSQ